MATPKTTINIHPKVFTGLLVGLASAAVTAIIGAIDPSMFSALGVWGAPAFSVVTTGLVVLGGWLKRVNAPESPAISESAPAPVVSQPTITAPAPAPLQVQLVSSTPKTNEQSRTQSSVIS